VSTARKPCSGQAQLQMRATSRQDLEPLVEPGLDQGHYERVVQRRLSLKQSLSRTPLFSARNSDSVDLQERGNSVTCSPCLSAAFECAPLILLFRLLNRFPEELTPALHPLLKPLGTVTVGAGPWFRSAQVATTTTIMGVLDLKEFKIFFPVWTLFLKRSLAKADFNPSDFPVFYGSGLGHISQVLVASNRACSESAFSN
jgi:hypothetical protein